MRKSPITIFLADVGEDCGWVSKKSMFVEYTCAYTNRKLTLRNKVLMFTIDKDTYIGSYHIMVSTAHFKTYNTKLKVIAK